jgi:hypothetical protein
MISMFLSFSEFYFCLFSNESSLACVDISRRVSSKHLNASGLGSTTLAEAITMNNPSKPRICQSGKEGRTGSENSSGVTEGRIGVCVGKAYVGANVTDGTDVIVIVGDIVIVGVHVTRNGITMTPLS